VEIGLNLWAGAQSDTAAATEMQQAKDKLFASFQGKKTA
jgi:hypothetical protein